VNSKEIEELNLLTEFMQYWS